MVVTTDMWFAIAVGAVISLLALVALSAFDAIRGSRVGKANPTIEEIFHALTPYLYRAILAGERVALWGMNGIDTQIKGSDKKAVADSVYALLPDVIPVGGLSLPVAAVKLIITRDDFERWVKEAYDSADAFILRNEVYLKSQVENTVKG